MKINYTKQVGVQELANLNVALFLLAGNHEKRVFTAYDKISKSNIIERTVLLRYKDSYKPSKSNSRKIEVKTVRAHQEVSSILDEAINKCEGESTTIVVDYSCMTKSWYYTIILFLKKKSLKLEEVQVYFVYTPSRYSEPLDPKPNTEMAPLPGKYIVPTDRPKALIVCLGYEQNKAEGIIEHLDPKECYLLYSKPALDNRFVGKIEENNKDILRDKTAITFPLDDLLKLEEELTSLYFLLKNEYSVIIAPLGPKPFTLISMLMTIRYRDIDIWRVGSGSDINEYDREPIDENLFIINRVVFEQDALDRPLNFRE